MCGAADDAAEATILTYRETKRIGSDGRMIATTKSSSWQVAADIYARTR